MARINDLLIKIKAYYRRNPRRVRIITIVLVVLGIISFGTTQLASVPTLCGNCHEIYPSYDSWNRSIHSEIACGNCHEAPGVTGIMTRMVLQLTVFNKPSEHIEVRVKDRQLISKACRQCHSANRTMAFDGGLTVPHEKHLAMGYTCVTCHSNIVHGAAGESSRKPKMETCMRCHNGKTAPEGCGVCHLSIPDPTNEYYIPD